MGFKNLSNANGRSSVRRKPNGCCCYLCDLIFRPDRGSTVMVSHSTPLGLRKEILSRSGSTKTKNMSLPEDAVLIFKLQQSQKSSSVSCIEFDVILLP